MKILVSGANGYLGLKLVKSFLEKGNEVLAVVRRHSTQLEVLKNAMGGLCTFVICSLMI